MHRTGMNSKPKSNRNVPQCLWISPVTQNWCESAVYRNISVLIDVTSWFSSEDQSVAVAVPVRMEAILNTTLDIRAELLAATEISFRTYRPC